MFDDEVVLEKLMTSTAATEKHRSLAQELLDHRVEDYDWKLNWPLWYAIDFTNNASIIEFPSEFTVIRKGANSFTLTKYSGKTDCLEIPDGITRIGAGALEGISLRKIILPESVCSIDVNAFGVSFAHNTLQEIIVAKENSRFYVDQGCLIKDEDCFSEGSKKAHWIIKATNNATISNRADKIRENAFTGWQSNELHIPDNIQYIASRAFIFSEELKGEKKVYIHGNDTSFSLQSFFPPNHVTVFCHAGGIAEKCAKEFNRFQTEEVF